MKLHWTVVLGLVAYVTAASNRRQTGRVEPDTDPDCSYYDTVFSASDNCAYLEGFWGVSHADFVAWNPSVKSDCSGIKIGNSYCVEVTRKPNSTSSRPTSTSSPTPTNSPKPSPTQDGLINSCTNFYFAVKDDNCQKIAKRYGTFTVAEFINWNPAVGSDCLGLWANTYYCVGIPGTPTAPIITTTVKATSTLTGTPKPSPTQDGLISSCTTFYLAVKDDNCAKAVKKFGTFTLRDFITWNPAVEEDCSAMWADTYYCVGIPGRPTARPSSSSLPPTTTLTTPTNGITTPLPTQPGMVANCDAFYFVPKNQGCQAIADQNFITLSQFLTWNPNIGGSACGGLWAEVYVCVSIIGHTPSKPASTTKRSTATPTPTGCTVAHPEPTQPGSICKCKRWYLPVANEYCADIEKRFGITAAQFNAWNPSIGTTCGGLWKDVYVCVSG
ncbi:carbohydrate-binding module family 50 protein [Pleomassaria siparia CBS 279.74]|uniref:Carbohydrate-binding module family 50 protein n=1 Tax=Pleomassaria siparia CBS 279.74 TaxID=1314801 RepID=A0A6G1KFV4_9PLEO|nr:carbohydrate-binding module family 50 protein [Pleomassaria siparia CBS 279.74]